MSRRREACWKLESCEAFVPKTEVTLLGCPDGQIHADFLLSGWVDLGASGPKCGGGKLPMLSLGVLHELL